MAAGNLRSGVRALAPELSAGIDALCKSWLEPLLVGIEGASFRPKQVNDVVWGTIELLPWEVALLDTPLLQRMRGIRQLGLAHLVFPGAVHDRLEHIIGVVGAVERMVAALQRQIDRWNRENKSLPLPDINAGAKNRLRLAALFHDLGHGPFSHALEPVLETVSPLGTAAASGATSWRHEIGKVLEFLKTEYRVNSPPAVSEIIAVMIILSDAVTQVLGSSHLITESWASGPDVQEQLVACVIGAFEGPGADHLSAIVSSQLDADRMDFLARDAHHAGLSIGFDTDRLLSRLEVLQIRQDNTPDADDTMRGRIAQHHPTPVLQIGIAASGFGSFEQMLIGRTFLYDRLYHHHKVRAAEAMAQRMLLVAERDRGKRLDLGEIFLSVGDDTFVRIFAEEVIHASVKSDSKPAARIATDLLNRRLLHRAYAFRARFILTPPGLDDAAATATRNMQWRRLLKSLETLGQRYEIGVEIHAVATRAAEALRKAGIDQTLMDRYLTVLGNAGPEQIIVDLPRRKADSIRILARYPDGSLKVPEFSFNPVKWADAYDLQKRTGYVFCPRAVVPMIALAANIVFMAHFGIVMGPDAAGIIKAGPKIDPNWVPVLVTAGVLDQAAADQLQAKRYSLLKIELGDLKIPDAWIKEKSDFAYAMQARINADLNSGLTKNDLVAFSKVMHAMFAFMDMWYAGDGVTQELKNEADLQGRLLTHLRTLSLDVKEGTAAGGGNLDLFVENAILIENKFQGTGTSTLSTAAPTAGVQGRRYAVALLSQIVISVVAVRVSKSAEVPQRSNAVEVRQGVAADGNRIEIKFTVPFGAPVPSTKK